MKTFIEKVIFNNRAPFENFELDLSDNDIAVLSGINGSGKTTIQSHIIDAWYEMARPHFTNEFEDKPNKFYRVSTNLNNLEPKRPSFVYIRFKTKEGNVDYVDIRNKCTEEQYNEIIKIEDKIPFSDLKSSLDEDNYVKITSSNYNKQLAENIFFNNLITYFPSYRYEIPGYLNEPYKIKIDFKKQSGFSGYLKNPIEVVTGLSQLANWILDIVLDIRQQPAAPENIIFSNLNNIITQTCISKKIGPLRFGIGSRGMGFTRIQILNSETSEKVYPSIFALSSGESSVLSLFGELLRQADNYSNNILLEEITGIVLIDEVDKHLHIKIQKEVLPKLFKLFPNVQFIISSHSPFLSMGLAEEVIERTKIIDLDNFGISSDPTINELYTEVYNMMIGENDRFKGMVNKLNQIIQKNDTPLIMTEGKTDVQHIRKAKEILRIENCEIEFCELDETLGEAKLKELLEQFAKVKHTRKIIGIFDRDNINIVNNIEGNNQFYKNYSNNVYGFCIPVPDGREKYENLSIEFYYSDEVLKKEKDGRRLFFNNEVDDLHNKTLNKPELRILEEPRIEKEFTKKIFDIPNMCELSNRIHSKAKFASLIESDEEFIKDIDFSNFKAIFDRIKLIINGH